MSTRLLPQKFSSELFFVSNLESFPPQIAVYIIAICMSGRWQIVFMHQWQLIHMENKIIVSLKS